MSQVQVRVVAAAGVAATLGGLGMAAFGMDPLVGNTDPDGVLQLLAYSGLLGAAYLLYDVTRSGSEGSPVPWSDAGPLVETPPEAQPASPPLTGWVFADTLSAAVEAAREQRELEPGFAIVRDPLREAYLAAMERGGVDRATAERDLADGSWTDDQLAAAVLSASVALPPRPVRRRIADWLYPGRAVRRMTRRAVDAVARESTDRVPSVVGQDAPRNVPVARQSLASLQRGPDGEVRRSPDGEIRRGPDGEIRDPGGPRRGEAATSGEESTPAETDHERAPREHGTGSDDGAGSP